MGRALSLEKKQTLTVNLNILGMQEDGQWLAIALEMDLIGVGATYAAAFESLLDAIKAQVRFCVEKKMIPSIFKAAPPIYWQLFEQTRMAVMKAAISGNEQTGSARVDSLPISHLVADAQKKKSFSRVHAAA